MRAKANLNCAESCTSRITYILNIKPHGAQRILMRHGTIILVGLITFALGSWPGNGLAHHQPDEELSINLSLSGGGTRAAAFAHGVLLELDEIRLCWKIDQQTKEHKLTVLYTRRITKDNCDNLSTRPLLEELKSISGVSGGAITAAHYKASRGNEWKRSFREALLSKNIELELLSRIQSSSALLPDPLFRPALAVTSIVDVAKYFATLPFKLTGLKTGFMNPDFTPALFLASGQGLIKPDEMSELYRDWIFPGSQKNLTFGTLGNEKPFRLLINATDIKNGSIFTFDENTFTCMGLAKSDFTTFPIFRALAASSALPVIFSPHNLSDLLEKAKPEMVAGENCAILLADKNRAPLLLDGGIVENLGLAKLLQEAFWRKNYKWNPHHDAAEQTFLISVNAAVQGGSGLPTLGKGSTIPQDLDQSFDVLMTSKTDVTRTIFESALSPFGFRFIELRFPDISRNNTTLTATDFTTDRVALQRLGVPFGSTLSKADLTRMSEESSLFRQEREKAFQDLNSIGMAPTKEQIDLLIYAGRAVVADRFDEIKEQLQGLTKQKYQEMCGEILNITKNYCWPEELTDKDLLRSPLRVVLSRFDHVKEQHINRITANRTRAIEILQGDIRERLGEEFKAEWGLDTSRAGRVVNDLFCEALREDKRYFDLYKDSEQVASLDELLNRCTEIGEAWQALTLKIDGKPSDVQKRAFVDKIKHILYPSPPSRTQTGKHAAFVLGAAKLTFLDDREGITLLYQALNQDPSDININELLGRYMILKRSDYTRGLTHILTALKSSRSQHQKLITDAPKIDRLKTGDNGLISLYQEQLERFRQAEQDLKRIFVELYLASPTGTPIEPQQPITDQEVTDWLKTHYPNGNGGTVVERVEINASGDQVLHRHCLLLDIKSHIELKGLKLVEECKETHHTFLNTFLKTGKTLTPDENSGYRKQIDDSLKRIREHAENQLAQSNGMRLALQYAEEGYSVGKKLARPPNKETTQTKSYLLDPVFRYRSEGPLYWGLALLIASGNAPCPERRFAVEKAKALIEESENYLREGGADGGNDHPTDTQLNDSIPGDKQATFNFRLKNLSGYKEAHTYFECVGNGE